MTNHKEEMANERVRSAAPKSGRGRSASRARSARATSGRSVSKAPSSTATSMADMNSQANLQKAEEAGEKKPMFKRLLQGNYFLCHFKTKILQKLMIESN